MSPINDRTSPGLECSFCTPVSRRDFVKTIGAGAFAAAVPIIGQSAAAAGPVQAGPTPKSRRRNRCRSFLQDVDRANSASCSRSRSTTRCGRGSETTGPSSSRRSVT